MDFDLDDDQKALSELAARILSEQTTAARLKAVETEAATGGDGVDHQLWDDMAAAGLAAAPLAEEHGGAGMGLIGAAAVLEEVGRRVAPVPYLETVVSALALERFGSPALREHLADVASGSLVIAPALVEAQASPRRPSARAVTAPGALWRLDGEKICVPAGLAAGGFLVPASLPDGSSGVFYVGAEAGGLERERQNTTTGRPEALLRLSSVEVPDSALLGAEASEQGVVLDWLVDRVTAGLCVTAAGCLDEALRITAAYVKERKQFDRFLATFQAVGQRAADAFIDTLGVRLTAWEAIWRLSVGLPAADEVTIAKYWASEAGQRVVHTCQHLHGGVGMDRDYPVHRYFLVAKQIDLALGGAAPQLADLGKRIAASA
ncbi:MAG: acyl-CoA dehydrogenase family protein [Acidimicrobiales bacterium]|jgi:alkylation response protein AidB-like acyl-CoA dehydrogenase